jgi:hypothetical protein
LHEGAAEARPVELNEMGEIVNWPDGFFGDLTGEAMAMAEAVGRRKAAGQDGSRTPPPRTPHPAWSSIM